MVPTTQFNIFNLQIVIGGGKDSSRDLDVDGDTFKGCESNEEFISSPSVFSTLNFRLKLLYFLLSAENVKKLKKCADITCDGYKDQFKALLIATEVGQPSLGKTATRKSKELKKLSCSHNYNNWSSNVFRAKGKESAVFIYP